MKFTEATSLLPLGNSRGSSLGATMVELIQVLWLWDLAGASACRGSIPKKRGQAGPWSMGPAAFRNVGSGFESHPWAQIPRCNELPILTDSNNDGPTPEAHFKPTFKQVFDPKTSTIAAFLTIYELAMRQASDEVKKEHILTCLHLTCQEVVVPELPTIDTWEDMKQLLIVKFGGDLSLEVKKDAFMHIAFKPKETLAEFSDIFYMEGQQLITSRQLTAHKAYMACAQALKVNQLLCLHFKAHKAMLSSMKSIKTLLQDMHLTHSGAVIWENCAASNSGLSFCGPCILIMNLQNPP
ncbi:hypothetical protein DSO57_1033434 [Entomophthora muscae]|uniref:Uncharacterized protein n=1 Tax=Entomophthora muscae TaxID=34485 RepID=A0ACC2ULT3_9FUNG|nr:hypothetical protein DSO57_1033434 [Entomophthora muscae]